VDIALDHAEGNAALTVNENETLLMRHDLVEVLRNPLKFAVMKSRHMLQAPRSIPGKTLDYAKYDFVRAFNSLMEALRLDESALERLVAKVMAVPARRFLHARRVSFLASDHGGAGRARVVRGTYQSPILVQWRPPAHRQVRRIQVSLVRFR
jgi:hypothetical protein